MRKENQRLRADRRDGGAAARHFLIDTKKRVVVDANVDLEKLARRLQVLEPWERAVL